MTAPTPPTPPPIEPHADLRQLATMHRQMFVAWIEAGFSEYQAMQMLRTMIRGASS